MARRGLAPLRHGDFRRLLSGQLASNFGDAFYAVALPWYVLADHGGALRLGEVLAAYGVARTGSLAVGGQVSDRLRPWVAMLGADLVRAVALLALTIVAAGGPARLALLLPIAVVVGAGEGIFLPALFAVVPALLPDEDLQAGNALTSGGTQLATLVGPAMGGLVVTLAGPAPAFGVDGASFLVSALTLAGIAAAARRRPDAAEVDATSKRSSLWLLIRRERIIGLIFAVDIAANLGSGGMSDVALPSLAHGPFHAGATGYGALVAAFAGGGLIGVLVAAQARRARRPALVASAGFLGAAGFMAAVPYLGGTVPAAATLVGCGSLSGFSNVLTITAMQRWAPREMLGRIMGFLLLGSYGIFPVSVVVGGVIVHADGPAVFFPLAAAVLALGVVGSLTQRVWREFGAIPDTTAEPAGARA